MVIATVLAGCSSLPSSVNPVEWWHGLQGGAIAEQRPPPPGATDPFPNLATVPGKPAPADPNTRRQIADALVADRSNAQHEASLAPLPDPSSRTASPALFGQGSTPPPAPPKPPSPNDEQASASLPAATPPPAPRQPAASGVAPSPEPAPVGPVASVPLGPAPGSTGASAPNDAASFPALPAAAPQAPALAGVSPTAGAGASRRAAPAAPAPAAAAAGPPVAVAFARGSADLPSSGAATLRGLVAQRGARAITVTGYGEANSSDPQEQSSALALGLSRAQAMAAALTAAGVPPSAVQIDAEAAGRGGTARLVD
ncbi:MAG: OmpA family protein [Acetobacteraceae bacterium]|nr:OmpA family protein [Acetobacteraceae bacterium]